VVSEDADEVAFFGVNGKMLQTTAGGKGVYKVHGDEVYVRAVATRKSDGARGYTQPIFVNK
jgi:hypothetical protein